MGKIERMPSQTRRYITHINEIMKVGKMFNTEFYVSNFRPVNSIEMSNLAAEVPLVTKATRNKEEVAKAVKGITKR